MRNSHIKNYKILPSILGGDLGKLVEEAQSVDIPEIEYIHVDIMDGHFVPNLTMGPAIVRSLKKHTRFKLDVHLMISNAPQMIPMFTDAGADILTIHQEAVIHLHREVNHIRERGIKAGVSLNPSTSLDTLRWVLSDLDLVLIMSVSPGFGGQEFIEQSLVKVNQLEHWRQQEGASFFIEVDGGIDARNAARMYESGARYFVAGTAIFHEKDRPGAVRRMIQAIEDTRKRQISLEV
jgi:ribulose-phosphate 3-epimerase